MDVAIHTKRWNGARPPDKILVIRFQALGDTIITLPYIRGIKKQFPEVRIDFFTRTEVSAVPRDLGIFENVFEIAGGRNAKAQFLLALLKIPELLRRRYDAVIDLQNNRISRIVRKLLRPKGWTAFDLYAPLSAGERTRNAIEALWQWKIVPETSRVHTPATYRGEELLKSNGARAGHEFVILNPAGYCSSRNWPLKNYVDFARKWLREVQPLTQFVLLLLPAQRASANYLKEHIGDSCIDLTGLADQVRAFQIVGLSALMLSEDSGLMHMAWTQGVPTIALFSSSRKDWSAPQGRRSVCLDSSDMSCGPCGLEICRYGDNRCLTRYSPDFVLAQANLLRLKNQDI